MTLPVIASGLYRLPARRMRGHADAQARHIFRDLIEPPADVSGTDSEVAPKLVGSSHFERTSSSMSPPSARATKVLTTEPKESALPAPDLSPNVRASKSALTRTRILAAAESLFVCHGVSGTRMEAVAELAGINKRMVYHHFGRREDLFLTVLENAYAKIRKAEQELKLDEHTPLEGFRLLVTFYWEYFLAHPEFLALVNQENLYRAQHISRSDRISVLSSSLIGMIRSLLHRGVEEGSCRRDIDPVQLWITIASISWFYIANTHTISATFGKDMLSPRMRKERLQHIVDFVLAYVSARRQDALKRRA